MVSETIPMLSLKRQQKTIEKQLKNALLNVYESCRYLPNPNQPTGFEKKLRQYCNKPYAVGMGSGSAALHIALLACDIPKKSEIVTVANSFYATTEAIVHVGAVPVFIDVHPDTLLMDIERLDEVITEKTSAILPVHLFGSVVNIFRMNEILKDIGREDIVIVEDCAHAFGSALSENKVPLGICGAFSFNPGKNCGALGDAGAIVTSDEEIYQKSCFLRDHGRKDKNSHTECGFNSRLNMINDNVLNVKIEYIDEWNNKRRSIASQYRQAFKDIEHITLIKCDENVTHAYHQFVIMVPDRDKLIEHLEANGVSTGIHYPTLISDQDFICRNSWNSVSDLTVSQDASSQILSLPCFPNLLEYEVRHIIDTIQSFYAMSHSMSLTQASMTL